MPTRATGACIPASGGGTTVAASGAEHAAWLQIGKGSTLLLAPGASVSAAGPIQVHGSFQFKDPSGSASATRVEILSGGALIGSGSVAADVANAGSVLVIDGGSHVPLRVTGRYTQSSGGSLLLRDEAAQFTRLSATGPVSLAGALDLLILDALVPGTAYPLISAESVAGQFIHPNGYRMNYGAESVTAVVTPEIQLSRSRVAPGQDVGVSAESFGYGGTLDFHLDLPTGPALGTCTVTSIGSCDGFAHIPAGTSPGKHLVVAIKAGFGYRAQKPLQVT